MHTKLKMQLDSSLKIKRCQLMCALMGLLGFGKKDKIDPILPE
jgi:hypothetical protein